MKFLKSRIFLLLLCLIFVFFFSNDFGIISVEKTAIVVALGIDREDDEYLATVQVSVPQASTETTENTKAIISGTGKTIAGALNKIANETGWYLKLSFCNLIIIGESMFSSNINDALDYCAKSLKITYSAIMAAADGKANELLEVASPLDKISSFALQKVLLEEHSSAVNVTYVDVNTFTKGYYSECGVSFLPLIKMISPKDDKEDNSVKPQASKQDSGSGSEQEQQDKNAKSFDATTTLIFKKGNLIGSMEEMETFVFNMLKKSAEKSYYPVDEVEIQGEKVDFLLNILGNKYNRTLKVVNETPTVTFTEKVHVVVEDHDTSIPSIALGDQGVTPEEVLRKAEKDFSQTANDLFNKAKELNADIFDLIKDLYRYNYDYYGKFKDNLYRHLKMDIKVEFIGQK